MKKFCRQCGARLEGTPRFCDACGAPTGAVGSPPPAATEEPHGVPAPMPVSEEFAAARAQTAPSAPTAAVLPARAHAGHKLGLKLGLGGGVLLLCVAVGYAVASPWIVLAQWRALAEQQSFVELVERLGTEGLEVAVFGTVSGAAARVQRENREVGLESSMQLEALTSGIGEGLRTGLRELLQPANLRQMQAAARQGGSMLQQFYDERQQAEAKREWEQFQQGLGVSLGYTGVNGFRVKLQHPQFGEAHVDLRRAGLFSWELADADFSEALAMAVRQLGAAPSPAQMANAALERKRWETAARWLRVPPREGGGDDAQFKLGLLELMGLDGTNANPADALKRMHDAAMGGDEWHAGTLARMYRDGYRVERDFKVAAEWYARVYEATQAPGVADQLVDLHVIMRDWASAREWHRRAAQGPAPRYGPNVSPAQRLAAETYRQQRILARGRAIDVLSGSQAAVRSGDLPNGAWMTALAEAAAKAQGPLQPLLGLGPLQLGMTEDQVEALLGQPESAFRWKRYRSEFPEAVLTLGFNVNHDGSGELRLTQIILEINPVWRTPLDGLLQAWVTEAKAQGLLAPEKRDTDWLRSGYRICPLGERTSPDRISQRMLFQFEDARYTAAPSIAQMHGVDLALCHDTNVSYFSIYNQK